MAQITNRRINVIRYDDSIAIMLSWFEVGKEGLEDMQSKHFRFTNPVTFKKVEEAINLLVSKWAHVFLSGFDMSVVSNTLDENPARFDWLLEHTVENGGEFFTGIREI